MEEQQHRNTLPKGFWLNEYKIETVLGKPGGFGITYLATDTHLRQKVAIKEYLPSDFAVREGRNTVYVRSSSYKDSFQWGLKCFIEEARVLARFNHPNIVRVLRFFEANGTAYMVMEYQHGLCLTDYIKERHFLVEEELLRIVLPLLDGLRQIHNAGYLHRDIKPNNIYIRGDKTPVLLDFGSARYAVGQRSRSVTSIVTPGYAPLEQYDNEISDQGPWTDIYALGAVMYCAISGEAPPAATRRVMKDPMIPAVKVGEGKYNKNLLQAIDWALQLSEEDRPQSVDQWQQKILANPTPLSASLPKQISPNGWKVWNIGAGIIILGLFLVVGVLAYYNSIFQERIELAINQTKTDLNARLKEEQVAREIAEKQLDIERKRRKEAEHDYLQARALIEVVERFEPQLVSGSDLDFAQLEYYDVTNVPKDEHLNIREFPGHLNKIVGIIPRNSTCVKYLSKLRFIKTQVWVKVGYKGAEGWVNSYYLMRTHKQCVKDNAIENNH